MIVPEFWSEAKERISSDGRQRTIKRFGWSDISEEDAHKNAQQRVGEAVDLYADVPKPEVLSRAYQSQTVADRYGTAQAAPRCVADKKRKNGRQARVGEAL